jgi:hypothetical protein
MGLASVARGHGGFQFERPERRDLRERLQCAGFVILSEVPNEEIVISVAGRFWRPDGGRCMELTAKDFAPFSRPGFAKVAWNFKLRADSPLSRFFQRRRGSSVSHRPLCGNFASVGVWSARSLAVLGFLILFDARKMCSLRRRLEFGIFFIFVAGSTASKN